MELLELSMMLPAAGQGCLGVECREDADPALLTALASIDDVDTHRAVSAERTFLKVLGAQGLARGARVRVRLGAIDEITLDVSGTVIEQLDVVPAASADDTSEEDEDEVAAGPIAIAVDMDETDTPAVPTSAASADNPTP